MIDIIPGILEKDFAEIEKKLQIIKPFSKKVHIDFLDGKFCEEKSFLDFAQFSKYKDDFFLEAHLMVEDPNQYIKPLANAGFKRFLGHIEKMGNLEEFIAKGQIFGEVGLALDIDTSVESISINFDDIDTVLLMSVKAGKSGQEFLPEVLEKIRLLRQITQITIEIDGGINEETLIASRKAGAQRFVATSAIFQSQDPMESYEKLLSLN
ncbi:MAG: hypothetical protein AAB702_02650 [Patescibacteria group bacterium]